MASKNKATAPVSASAALALANAAPAAANSETITAVPAKNDEQVIIETKDVGTVEQLQTTNDNSETITAAPAPAAAPTAEVIQSAAPAAVSKASVANAIFKEMFSRPVVPARKDMIKAAMAQAKLTEKGAATYLQNYKAKNGLTHQKTAATA